MGVLCVSYDGQACHSRLVACASVGDELKGSATLGPLVAILTGKARDPGRDSGHRQPSLSQKRNDSVYGTMVGRDGRASPVIGNPHRQWRLLVGRHDAGGESPGRNLPSPAIRL